ncbi:CoA transferase [Pigmentiphaga soli]|uniref:CoA transferase n=1 Tax=Pigmentiphaga soli TaxID=1007095 RepID=A0ABP8GDY4_9BURK
MQTQSSAPEPGAAPAGPLAGVRIVELCNIIAGPTACAILGDYGAEVIKIEHPDKGDGFRDLGQKKQGMGVGWKALGRNKRSVGLYLGDPQAREVFLELVRTADVVVDGFRVGTLEKWDLGYERLRAVNPAIILTRLSGYGPRGPYSHRPAFGSNLESLAGFPSLTGEPDGPPLLTMFAIGDIIAGMCLTSAILMALYHRDARGGGGQVVEASILAPLLTVMMRPLVTYDQVGYKETRTGNRSNGSAPRRSFRTKDGKWVSVAAATFKAARDMMRMVERPDFEREPWFQTGVGRLQHAHLLEPPMEEWMARHTRDEILRIAEEQDVTIGPILEVDEIFEDPHIKTAGFIREIEDKDFGRMRMPDVMFRFSETPGAIRWTGEHLGESTDAVLVDELGIDPAVLEGLRRRGVAH